MKKQKPTKSDKVYIFEVSLDPKNPYSRVEEKVWRDIAILGSQSLYKFAESIVDAFGFNFDHCFGFFDNLKRWTDSTVKYELFADMPETMAENLDAKSVEKTKVQQVFKNNDDKMLFLFDYGDNWEFIVKLKNIEESDNKKSYPFMIEGVGKAPEQYPPLEEDEE